MHKASSPIPNAKAISKEFLTNAMEVRIVRITDKGQVSIPAKMQEATGMGKGDQIIMIENNNTIIMKKIQPSEFRDLIKHQEKIAAKLWGTKHDDIWDKV